MGDQFKKAAENDGLIDDTGETEASGSVGSETQAETEKKVKKGIEEAIMDLPNPTEPVDLEDFTGLSFRKERHQYPRFTKSSSTGPLEASQDPPRVFLQRRVNLNF